MKLNPSPPYNSHKPRLRINCAKIKAIRFKFCLSQEDAAREAGLAGRQHWYKIETGKCGATLATLERIARVLDTTVKDLLK